MAHVTHNCQDGSIGTRQACDNNGPRVKQQQKDVLTIPGMFNFHGGVAIRFWQNIMRQGYYSTYIIAPSLSFLVIDILQLTFPARFLYTHTQLVNPLNCADDCYQLLFVGVQILLSVFLQITYLGIFFYFLLFKNDSRQIVNSH